MRVHEMDGYEIARLIDSNKETPGREAAGERARACVDALIGIANPAEVRRCVDEIRNCGLDERRLWDAVRSLRALGS